MLPTLPSKPAADPSSFSAPARPKRTRSTVMRAGINNEPLQAPEAPAAGPSEGPLPAIGNGARTALNAAALQTLSMKQAMGQQHSKYAGVRVYRGNLLHDRDPVILDGVRSADVSYIADTRGHGSSMATAGSVAGGPGAPAGAGTAAAAGAGLRMRPQPPTVALTRPSGGRRLSGGLLGAEEPSTAEAATGAPVASSRAEVLPASRAEAVATADQLRLGLLGLPAGADVEAELQLWDAAFGDAVRQVRPQRHARAVLRAEALTRTAPARLTSSPAHPHPAPRQVWVHCNERGQLLGAIRARYADITSRLLHFRRHAVEERGTALASLTGELEAEAEARRKAASTVFKFARASHAGLQSRLEAEISEEQRRQNGLQADMEQARTRAPGARTACQGPVPRSRIGSASMGSASIGSASIGSASLASDWPLFGL